MDVLDRDVIASATALSATAAALSTTRGDCVGDSAAQWRAVPIRFVPNLADASPAWHLLGREARQQQDALEAYLLLAAGRAGLHATLSRSADT